MKSLVVDDDGVSLNKMQKILGEFGACVLAETGKDALEEFNHAWSTGVPFDLVALDISMPDMSGLEVLAAIRSIEKEKNLPKARQCKVIMVTASSDQDVVIGSVKAGCNNYIVKPFDRDRVVDKLKSLDFKIK
jgi:two-component system chemotaxis response regulator CheY